ncbi:MAG: glycosyltransferase [Candidatus Peribacteraceae bacterium]|nr:glycosyltransferase [Candidatus Peribacteraceae bacterium]MDD5739305.1 glycosyltransferase [Candidatus Peribacteraceae bacterium]
MERRDATIGVFAGFPPEHSAHIIEAAFTVRALQQMQFRNVVGVTASTERPPVQMLDEGLVAYHAENILHPLPYPHIPVANVQDAIDGYDIRLGRIHKLMEEFGMDVLYLTYHPLCGAKLIEAVGQTRAKTLLLAKMALVSGDQRNIFSGYHRDYDRSLEEADGIIALQENDARLIRRRYPQAEDKIHVVHKFVDHEFLSEARKRAPNILNELGIAEFVGEGEHVVGCFGRIDPEKNAVLLAQEIWPLVEKLVPSARLVMMGTGTQSDEIRSIVQDAKGIRLLERQIPYVDLLALLTHMDVLAFPSGTDYTPRIPMDALLMGSRVVACDLNFNDVFRPYAKLVPTTKFRTYKPYGFNDNTRLLPGYEYQLPYGVPEPEAFAAGIAEQLYTSGSISLPSGLFTTAGFVREFSAAMKDVIGLDS